MWSLPLATTLLPMPPVSWLSIWVRGQDNMKTEPQWWISSSCPSLSWSGRRDQWGSHSPGDHFDDWQWSFWWFTMIFVVTDDDLCVEVTWLIILMIEDDHIGDDHFENWRWSLYTAHLADQAVLRVKRISRASWLDRLEVHTAHLGLGEEPWSWTSVFIIEQCWSWSKDFFLPPFSSWYDGMFVHRGPLPFLLVCVHHLIEHRTFSLF